MIRGLIRLVILVLLSAVLLGTGQSVAGTDLQTPKRPEAAPAPAATPDQQPGKAPAATPTTSAIPTSLRIVALGDSVTAGSHCDCPAFPELYARGLEATYPTSTSVLNAGVGGQSSDDVLTSLRSGSAEQKAVSEADVVLVTIGANDFSDVHDAVVTGSCRDADADDLGCAKKRLADLDRRIAAILARIRELRHAQPTEILVTGYWNVFQDGDIAEQAFSRRGQDTSDSLTIKVNSVIAREAGATSATYVDLYLAFKGARGTRNPTGLLADDGDHPNAAGHRVIARALLAAGLDLTPA